MKMLEYQRLIAQIDLDAIENNVKQIKKQLDKGTKMLAVVKADAYGHGAVEVSKICLFNGADQLGIATCEEGCALREANIPVPILILGYTVENRLETVIENDLTQAVFSVEMAQKLSQTAVRMGKTAKAHIKIDTGMGRIGFLPCEESLDVIDGIFKLPNLEITGIFTHFSTADEKDKTFTKTQFERFLYMTRGLEERGHTGLIRHCANSGAIIDMPELQLDMVRAGIILYGMLPSTEVGTQLDLIPAMSLKTHISYVKQVEAGTPHRLRQDVLHRQAVKDSDRAHRLCGRLQQGIFQQGAGHSQRRVRKCRGQCLHGPDNAGRDTYQGYKNG